MIIGYSDHCRPDASADVIKTAYVLGARIIEKHFTLDKGLSGNDHYHAMDPADMSNIVKGVAFVETLLGTGSLDALDSEASARLNARRSIVARKRIPKDAVIERDMLTFKRPGIGISPERIDEVIGSYTNQIVPEDTIILESMLR